MSGGGNEAWAAVRQAYEHSDMTLQDIYSTYNVTRWQIICRRKSEGWRLRRSVSTKGSGQGRPRSKKHSGNPRREDNRAKVRRAKLVVEAMPGGVPTKRSEPKRPCAHKYELSEHYDAKKFAGAVGQLMDRLFRITEKELSIIEERMEMGEIRSPADSARDTSSIGSLIKNLEKLTEFNEQVRGGANRRGSIAGITADEADLIRRDLARRIKRLNKG